MTSVLKQNSVYNKHRNSNFVIPKFLLSVILIGTVIFPIMRMLFSITRESFQKVFSSPVIAKTVINTLTVTSVATVITVILSHFLAVSMERTNIKFKGFFKVVLVLPMLIPSISHGFGLILLFGNNGIFTKLLNLNTNIYGFWGIVIGSVLYAFPVAFLMFSNVMKYEDSSPYEAAKVLNIPKWHQFTAITLPFLRKPLITTVFAIFAMIVTDYGVPLMVGGKFTTLPVVMYQEVSRANFDSGNVLGAILLIPAVIAFILDVLNQEKGNSTFVLKPFNLSENKGILIAAYIFTAAMSLFTLLPITSFIVMGFTENYPYDMSFSIKNIQNVIMLKGGDYLFNSLVIALATALIGTAIGFMTAYLTARSKGALSKILHLIAITAMAIPGIVLGLSYVIVFKGSFIYGTLIILIMANTIHFIASPYMMMYNSLGKINSNLEAVGETLGIGKFRLIKDVFLPQCFSTLIEMFSYFFVNSMMTISAVSFLAKTATKPISLMINQFEAQSQLGNAAIVSLIILTVNLIVKGISSLIKHFADK